MSEYVEGGPKPLYKDDPEWWWGCYGKFYAEERAREHTPHETQVLDTILPRADVKTVCEVGCGFGRIITQSVLKCTNVEKIVGLDFSSSQLKNARQLVIDPRVEFIQVDIFNGIDLAPFDLVYTFGVVHHNPPERIATILQNMVELSKKWLVLIEFDLPPGKEIKDYNGMKYAELGTYSVADAGINTWCYPWKQLLISTMQSVKIFDNFKDNDKYGLSTILCEKWQNVV